MFKNQPKGVPDTDLFFSFSLDRLVTKNQMSAKLFSSLFEKKQKLKTTFGSGQKMKGTLDFTGGIYFSMISRFGY